MPNLSHSSGQILNFMTKIFQRILWTNNTKDKKSNNFFWGVCIYLGYRGKKIKVLFLIFPQHLKYFQLHMVSCHFSVFIFRYKKLSEQLNTEVHIKSMFLFSDPLKVYRGNNVETKFFDVDPCLLLNLFMSKEDMHLIYITKTKNV